MLVGNHLVYTDPGRSFHELLRSHLAHALGTPWIDRETLRPEAERHPLAQWFVDWNRVIFESPESRPIGEGKYVAPADGGAWRLLLLGRDLWQLRHSKALPRRLLARLRDPLQFQGALYEIAVAAIVARAGFRISWHDTSGRAGRTTEFIAECTSSGRALEVEAKSRHRPGVLGREGERPPDNQLVVDCRGLLEDAIRKDPAGRPYLVFVDLNSPSELDSDEAKRLLKELEALTEQVCSTQAHPGCGYNALIVTNIAYHYGAPLQSLPDPWYAVVRNAQPSVQVEEGVMIRIIDSLHRYEEVPKVD